MQVLAVVPSDTNFIVPGLGAPDVDQPSPNIVAKFGSEQGMDLAIGSTVPAKDKPHLTLNDKEYAARCALGGPLNPHAYLIIEPAPAQAPAEEPVAP